MPSDRRSFLAAAGTTLAALSGCVTFDPPATTGTWPRSAIDNAHTGRSKIEGPTTSLYEVWHRDRPDGGALQASPVVGNGRVYTVYSRESTTNESDAGGAWLEAFDAGSGESRWKTELFRSDEFYYFYASDSLVLDSDTVYVQTKPGLKAVGTDGTVRWTFDNLYESQQTPDVVSPVVTDDVVIAGTYSTSYDERGEVETVYGIDPNDGSERWRTEFPELDGMWQLSAADGVVYVPFRYPNGWLVALDVRTGEELWRRRIPVNGTPTIADGRLFSGLNDGRSDRDYLGAFDPTNGTELWRKRIGPRWADSGFAVADGLVYHIGEFNLVARRVETGERVWTFGGSEKRRIDLRTTPVVAGDSVYVNGYEQRKTMYGRTFVLNTKTGETRGQFALGRNRYSRSSPAVADELVFVNSNAGRLFAVGECDTEIAGHCVVG
ncbi:PQQ-binding-like beta-propeller repeat protein [Haladaptatus sp. CMAA 1911]|uniref:outer membrane protein assembly factor BamB family protein n=1 Tax=unclassified Haladaptatus TaxID=2622732 RepID=UPI0037543597